MSNNNLDEELVDFNFDDLDSSPTNENHLNESNTLDSGESDNSFSDAFEGNDVTPFDAESLGTESLGEIDQNNSLDGLEAADTVQLDELPEELTTPPKKKGWFSKKEKAASKGKTGKPKKEAEKEKTVSTAPKDWDGILCLVFTGFLLFAMLAVNVCSILGRGENLMQTLCFIGAFDCIGLCAASVPITFYRHREELNVFKVMLGISSVALFVGVLILLTELYHYNFIIKP